MPTFDKEWIRRKRAEGWALIAAFFAVPAFVTGWLYALGPPMIPAVNPPFGWACLVLSGVLAINAFWLFRRSRS